MHGKRIALLAGALGGALLMIVTPASATLLVRPDGTAVSGNLQRCANTNPLPSVPTVVVDTTNPYDQNEAAYTVPGTIYIDPAQATCGDLRHELGHQFDYAYLTDATRSYIMRALGLHGDWRQPANSPHEQFAELYRMASEHRSVRGISLNGGPLRTQGGYDLTPTPYTFRVLRMWLVNWDRIVRSSDGQPIAFRTPDPALHAN